MDGSRPIANLREQRRGTRPGLEPRHLKNVPGRKTDVKDAYLGPPDGLGRGEGRRQVVEGDQAAQQQ